MTGTYDHRACGRARQRLAAERDAARAELAELRTAHETLLEEVGELRIECARLRELLNEARIADPDDELRDPWPSPEQLDTDIDTSASTHVWGDDE